LEAEPVPASQLWPVPPGTNIARSFRRSDVIAVPERHDHAERQAHVAAAADLAANHGDAFFSNARPAGRSGREFAAEFLPRNPTWKCRRSFSSISPNSMD